MRSLSAGRRGVLFGIVIVLLGALGAAAGLVGARVSAVEYSSSAVLLWDPSALRYSDDTAYVPDSGSLAVQVEAQLTRIQSDDVVDPAAKSLGMSSNDLRSIMTVSLGSNASEMVISATGATAARANAATKAIVSAYVDANRADLGAQYTAKADALQAPIDALTARVDALAGNSALGQSLAGQLSDDIAQQVSLRAQSEDPATPLSVTQAASLPLSPASASAATLAVVGAAIGLVVGAGLVMLLVLGGVGSRSRRRPVASAAVAKRPAEAA